MIAVNAVVAAVDVFAEVEVVREAYIAVVERTRPVVAFQAVIDETALTAGARSRDFRIGYLSIPHSRRNHPKCLAQVVLP